ncbi:type IV pilus twitching motility protein PilT [Vibrio sp. WXL210]|uniref:type IV pilus twitching motility protein PilT n=1 Tax=Vibrio sp. WXL210 TaxID=3450709 RepID=UPI003EC95113
MNIAELLEFSVKHNASDLHLSAGVTPMVRVDGEMRSMELPTLTDADMHRLLLETMSEEQQDEFERHREVDFSCQLTNIGRFRVNAFHQSRGCAAVFRTIPTEIPSLEQLGAPHAIERIANLKQGLVLVTGPTGSGKSTTLAAMIDYINRHHSKHILTIEDPIEYIHHSQRCLINQREVHRDTNSFSRALRSGLREDPDVILVGELRDHETIALALTAAETGHLVFATLHTSSAAKAVDRIIDVFAGSEQNRVRSMLSESLQAVIAQKLLKRVAGGRVACHEVMLATPAIRNLIREDKVSQMLSIIQMGAAQGMQTMQQSAHLLLTQGLISADEQARLFEDIDVTASGY